MKARELIAQLETLNPEVEVEVLDKDDNPVTTNGKEIVKLVEINCVEDFSHIYLLTN